ncbi:hypothetical protein BK147_04490 [Paenibacillus sp. FSL R7-0337]|nr:hypothetical protein BK147_04490 [Paenibacillus sp. FSL R7-0337]
MCPVDHNTRLIVIWRLLDGQNVQGPIYLLYIRLIANALYSVTLRIKNLQITASLLKLLFQEGNGFTPHHALLSVSVEPSCELVQVRGWIAKHI